MRNGDCEGVEMGWHSRLIKKDPAPRWPYIAHSKQGGIKGLFFTYSYLKGDPGSSFLLLALFWRQRYPALSP